MASNYPGSLDSFDTIASDKKTSDAVGGRTHRQMHNDLGDAIESVQTELGTDPAGASATVKARFEVIEANDWVTAARIAANAVGSSELADSAVDTAAIQDGAVTAAKLAVQPGNLLTPNQASIETDTTGWAADGATAVARSTAEAYHGSASLLVTSPAEAYGVVTLEQVPVAAGETYTLTAACKSASRKQTAHIYWYTAAGAYISASYALPTPIVPTTWARVSAIGIAPATAAFAALAIRPSEGGSAGDTAYWDAISFHKGAGGKWAMPGTPIVGMSGIATNNAVNLSGTGSPEGVVTAAPGSTWLQTDATTDVKGWIRWIKATGTGNTGWKVGPEADTGWRRILTWTSTDTFSLGTTPDTTTFTYESAGGINIRRVGDTVTVWMDSGNIKMAAGSSNISAGALLTLPTGFTAGHPQTAGALVGSATFSFTAGSTLYRASNSMLPGPGHYMPADWSLRFTSDDAWPTSLPGTAA